MTKPFQSFIITGKKGAGKSTICKRIFDYLRSRSISTGGVITVQNAVKWFYLLPIGLKIEFEAQEGEDHIPIGRFKVHKKHMEKTVEHIKATIGSNIVIIDEIGFLEMMGEGYHSILNQVLTRTGINIFVVKERILNDFILMFPHTQNYSVIRVDKQNFELKYNFLKNTLDNLIIYFK